jgi:DNA-binding MarR family transcriptional regulator
MPVNQCPCFNLGLAHRKLVKAFEEALAPLNLTIAQVHFLSCLYEQDAQSPKELARALAVDAGTLTPMIDRLERMGLVRRCPNPDDRRAMRICLNEAGLALKPAVQAQCQAVNDRLMSKFSPDDYEAFLQLVRQFASEAEADAAVRQAPGPATV